MIRGLVGLLPLVLIAALFPASAIAIAAPVPEAAGRSDRVLVRWSTRLSTTAARAPGRLAALASVTGREPAFVRFSGSGAAVYDLGAPLGADSGAILAALGEAEGVASVEPDLWMTVDALPSDPRAAELWGLLGAADGSTYGIDAPGAWTTSTGSGVVVAVIDTGLVAHEDLFGQAVAGYDMIWDGDFSNDGNGRDADASDPGDWCGSGQSSWHGTHVAGTIAALSSNAIGVFGGAPGVRIQPVRVLGRCGGYLSDVADGLRWAAGGSVPGVPANATPARVLNLSLGSNNPSPCPAEMASAIADAGSRGAVVVVAAGNKAEDASLFAPANCDGVITVAATDLDGQRPFFSNYGSVVDLSAPGVGILSTVDSGTTDPIGPAYASYNGTSMATPHVALAAALVAAAAPALTPAQIATILADRSTLFAADASAEGCPALGCGAGIVNAARAVAGLDTIAPVTSAPAASLVNGAALETTTVPVRLSWSGSDAGSGLARFELALSTNGGAWVGLDLPSPTARTLSPLLSPGATYRFRVRAVDAAGNASAWANGPIFRVRKIQESSTAIRYTGTWSRPSAAAALGGRYRLTTRARASATYTFTGKSIAWVATRGSAFGSARVYIDGVYRGTVNLRAPSTLWRRIVFSRAWVAPGRHTIRIIGSGTRGHPRVSLDAFVVVQ